MYSLSPFRLLSGAFSRYFHTSHIVFNVQRQSKIINKMLNAKLKRKWYEDSQNALPSVKSLSKTSREPGKKGSRRVAVLNKLFMKNITDLMSTGSIAREILGRGLEISKVNITPDFQIVNVFWVCSGSAQDGETEALLNRTAGALRHELSQLRVMGEVPTIMFIKDEQAARLLELDRRLARADYGADYQPTEIGHLLKAEFTLHTKLSPELKAKIEQAENEYEIGVESGPDMEEIPVMSHSVYGLEHANMAARMRAARRRSADAWSRLAAAPASPAAPAAPADDVVSYRVADTVPQTYDFEEQKKNLADFLQKRQILQDKLHRRLRSSADERRVLSQQQQYDDDERYEEDFPEEEEEDVDTSTPGSGGMSQKEGEI